MSADSWSPVQYNQFAAEREQPFWDLAALLDPVERPDLVDLGCGDGRLTAALGQRLGARSVVGIDSSDAMLEAAATVEGPVFEQADIAVFDGPPVDIVFSNAALQWVPSHEEVLERWSSALRPGGQLAVQVPANADHPAHLLAAEVAARFIDSPPPDVVAANVLEPARYAEVLYELGFERQHVQLNVYGHVLESTAAVVEWIKGTSLTRFKAVLPAAEYEQFVDACRVRFVEVLGDRSPYFYPFKRILMWGRR